MESIISEQNIIKEKSTHIPTLIISMLSIVGALLFALAGDILAIVGIILSVFKRNEYKTKWSLILSMIGLIVSIANHIVAFLILNGTIKL